MSLIAKRAYFFAKLLHAWVLTIAATRTKFADNLKRELPRIPFAADFWAFATAGRELARLHLEYDTLSHLK